MRELSELVRLKAYLESLKNYTSALFLPLKVYIDGDGIYRGYEVTLCIAQMRALADGLLSTSQVKDWYAIQVLLTNWEGGPGGN